MTIQRLFAEAAVVPSRLEGDAEASTMTMDSRRAKHGSLFVCMPSKNTDSNSFIDAAHAAGATSVLTYSDQGFEKARSLGMAAALLEADLYNDSLWKLCKVAFGNPSASMKVIGVTGTNGKTTTAWLIRDMLQALGLKAAYLGTLGFQLPGEERELQNTTPFAIELNELLAEARDKGVEAIAIEVSSHALAEKRVDGIEFDTVVFTNLTQDHLDFHGSMEEYAAAKYRLFSDSTFVDAKHGSSVFNLDDAIGLHWYDSLDHRRFETASVYGYGFDQARKPEVLGQAVQVKVDEIDLDIYTPFGSQDEVVHDVAHIPLGGEYNVTNCLCAAAAVYTLEGRTGKVLRALEKVRPVPGRFEAVSNESGIGILVDYAHTPDALEKLLDAVRPLTKGRVITVFGCGGDRDRTKRPKMAKAASERSDITVVTSDNPRTEDPQSILDEVLTGIVPGRESVAIIDRREAISHAIKIAKPGDVVVIAGKGHENYQIIGRTKHPMDDRQLARDGLAARNQ